MPALANIPMVASGSGRGIHVSTRLTTIPGTVPELIDLPKGCPFCDRCAYAIPQCAEARPAPTALGPGHTASCFRLEAVAQGADQHEGGKVQAALTGAA